MSSPTTKTPILRFGLFADAHYAQKVYSDRHCEDSVLKLQACMDDFANQELDFVVCMGDCIDTATDVEVEIANLRRMVAIFSQYQGPRHWVLGNHDVSALSKAQFLQLCGATSPSWNSFDVKGVHFVILDGNCHADGSDFREGDFVWDDAWIGTAQIQWLMQDLAAAKDQQVIVLCHENLDHRLWQDDLDPHVLRDADKVRQVLESAGNVSAVIEAHYHAGMQTVQGGIPYICLRAMVVGAGLANNAYATVSLHSDGTLEFDGVGQQPSYRIDGT